ncbi:DNA-binding response regulator [Clostridium sp. chh4-2]|uniref:response regulator transcription factor n=1 Tax=Clostridium sp. chh4-2 TaxID=2067550 RepID=UPI000CCDAA9C|nr:response regulator [Clostridium sp. chh4-2]PNV59707.1 DNA-binding response regulator [Clostridium sp. chh4-2]
MYTVIVADDEEALRKAIIKRVDWNAVGFEVIGEAENGAEALELVEKLGPDLLLTDIRMPFVSGIDLARQAREIRPYMQIAFLSGYESFAYAQQAIQYNIISYLLKPISAEELTEEMKRIKEKLDERFAALKRGVQDGDFSERERRMELSEFLLPILMDQDEPMQELSQEKKLLMEQRAAELGLRKLPADNVCYMVLVTGFFGSRGENLTAVEHVNFVNSILKKYVQFGSVISKGKIITVISAVGRDLGKYIHILVTEIMQSAERILGLQCRIGVSRDFPAMFMSGIAYSEAVAAMHYVPADAVGVQFISDMESGEFQKFEYIEEIVAELDQIIKTGSRGELDKFLASLFSRVSEEHAMKSRRDLLVIQILATVYRTVSISLDNNVPVEVLSKFSFLEKGFTKESLDEVHGKVASLCRQAQDIISNHRKVSSELLSDQALKLIETGYSDETLTLVSLSEQLHISSNYLSTTIKKTTGETFISLLTKKRMEKAREYLICTPMKIQEIAARCGYSDQHYFSYCFKKYYGKSPNKLREGAGKAEEK